MVLVGCSQFFKVSMWGKMGYLTVCEDQQSIHYYYYYHYELSEVGRKPTKTDQ